MNLALELIWTVIVAFGAVCLFAALAVSSPIPALHRAWLNLFLTWQRSRMEDDR